ncbi:MAG: type II toxin-antitoxin system RelE/ParE family toxin [Holosporaceae bacterium]|jgi:toxin ParE1/3/4|nr:type II toxin-antitoxin system RelE/ParE family toxin [Rhodospirillaceae bacterium]
MGVFRLTQLAIADLQSIGRYTQATWGREQRNRYLRKLDQAFQLLLQEPHLGRACDHVRVGYRKHLVGRHLIFYREIQNDIEIVRILHHSMDIDTHFD